MRRQPARSGKFLFAVGELSLSQQVKPLKFHSETRRPHLKREPKTLTREIRGKKKAVKR